MRLRWFIDRCLGRKHQAQILGRMSVQVKAPDSNNGTAWMLRCLGALWLDNSERFSAIRKWALARDQQAF